MNMLKIPGFRTIITMLFASLAFTTSTTALADDEVSCNKRHGKNIVVHLKTHTDDLQGTLVAARVAGLVQNVNKCDVTLFLTLRGARVADMRMPQNLAAGRDDLGAPNVAQAVAAFQANGGTVAVCPACASDIGLTAADLIPGATILSGPEVGALFAKADKVIDF